MMLLSLCDACVLRLEVYDVKFTPLSPTPPLASGLAFWRSEVSGVKFACEVANRETFSFLENVINFAK